jgi:hypothetical protein
MNELSRLCVLAMYILHCKTKRAPLLGELTFLLMLLWQMFFQNAKIFSKKEKKKVAGDARLIYSFYIAASTFVSL